MVSEIYEIRKRILADNIRKFMKANKLSEQSLARISGINYTTLNSWICCSSYPGQRNLIKLSLALGCEVSELTESESYFDERKRFLTIGQASVLYAYVSDRAFQRICDVLLRLLREKRLSAYLNKIYEVLEIKNPEI